MEELNFIAGSWRPAARTYARENPANPDETVGVYPESGKQDAHAAFEAAAAAFSRWKQTPIIQRARVLQHAARILEHGLEAVARDLAREVGKPIGEARVEVRRAVDLLDYYASYAWQPQGHLVASIRPGTELRSRRVPLGVVALITPWNFPIAIPTWKLAPALISGNTVVLKPATQGPAGAVHLVRALAEAGGAAGVGDLGIGPGAPLWGALPETDGLRG